MQKRYLEAGKIVGTHGVNGEVRVECWCDSPEFLKGFNSLYLDEGQQKLSVVSRPHKTIALTKIKGIDTVEQADMLRGKVLYIDRRDVRLPQGVNFVQDIVGLRVINADTDELYGTVTDVLKTGANDVYEMRSVSGTLCYIPVIPDVVRQTDVKNEVVRIIPMKGLLDDDN